MDTKIIVALIIAGCWLATLILATVVLLTKILPYKNKNLELKEREIKNKTYEMYMNISPELVEKSIEDHIDKYVKRYIAYKFVSKKASYIRAEETEQMVRDITKLVTIEISDLYIFYIKTLRSIDSDEDLVSYINTKVKNACVDNVTDFNSSKNI